MKDKEIDKIAQAIAAKLGEPGGPGVLGCGDASSTQNYDCSNYYCDGDTYECGGAGYFHCAEYYYFRCSYTFSCDSTFRCGWYFTCRGNVDCTGFTCYPAYNG